MPHPPRVVTFGEIMLRLAPPDHQRVLQARIFDITYGGGEANVAVALAQLGIEAAFVTRLPANDVAQACVNQLRGLGVDTRHVLRGGSRMGIYFTEHGASQRAGTVTYDRANSAVAEIKPGQVDWEAVFAGAQWFHFTGITPALSESAAAVTLEAAKAAKAKGLTVSCDLNYRQKLWTSEQAGRVMAGLMPSVDVCVANEEDAETVFGIRAEGAELTAGKIDRDRYAEVARKLTERFGFQSVAITLRESHSAGRNGWSGMLYAAGQGQGQAHFSRRYEVEIVDRLGGGDSFAAGLIYGLLHEGGPQEAVEFAAAASCLKHSIPGDFNLVKLEEVRALLAGDASGRVRR